MTDPQPSLPGMPRWHDDPVVRDTISRIRNFGLAITVAEDLCATHAKDPEARAAACPYAYTSGRSLIGEPELAVYGLGAEDAVEVLCDVTEELDVRSWKRLVAEKTEIYTESVDLAVTLVEAVDTTDLRVHRALFPNSPVLQVVWPDDHGFYPWEQRYSLRPADQYLKGVEGFARDVGPRVISRATGPNRAQRRKKKR
ncbi:DUF4262 domain-containing protein [Williamsia herbipolensis]|uniref:DUF4262 domain-containing protein n=1 Tax=Williamsia herbipolensis TaxID=1603258 RepID=A0AAU4K6D4_9NOCA|nr:DUF4262 domain-containing protein [Williamsia herbipolensis]